MNRTLTMNESGSFGWCDSTSSSPLKPKPLNARMEAAVQAERVFPRCGELWEKYDTMWFCPEKMICLLKPSEAHQCGAPVRADLKGPGEERGQNGAFITVSSDCGGCGETRSRYATLCCVRYVIKFGVDAVSVSRARWPSAPPRDKDQKWQLRLQTRESLSGEKTASAKTPIREAGSGEPQRPFTQALLNLKPYSNIPVPTGPPSCLEKLQYTRRPVGGSLLFQSQNHNIRMTWSDGWRGSSSRPEAAAAATSAGCEGRAR